MLLGTGDRIVAKGHGVVVAIKSPVGDGLAVDRITGAIIIAYFDDDG